MIKKIYVILSFLVLAMFLYPMRGVPMAINPDKSNEIIKKYNRINFSDGINKDEAIIIAQHSIVTDEENNWKDNLKVASAEVDNSGLDEGWWAVGFDATLSFKSRTGLRWFTIHIDKKTGEIKSKGWGPA